MELVLLVVRIMFNPLLAKIPHTLANLIDPSQVWLLTRTPRFILELKLVRPTLCVCVFKSCNSHHEFPPKHVPFRKKLASKKNR